MQLHCLKCGKYDIVLSKVFICLAAVGEWKELQHPMESCVELHTGNASFMLHTLCTYVTFLYLPKAEMVYFD